MPFGTFTRRTGNKCVKFRIIIPRGCYENGTELFLQDTVDINPGYD